MNALLKNLDELFVNQPEKKALISSIDSDAFTYGMLDEYSARAYRYLKERHIGREEIVLIHARRDIKIIALLVGIWKAGAAFVICEDSMSPERVRYIASDCGCCLVIGEKECEQIEETKPLFGRETVSPHDASYIVYTSGSTGNPKGVIHEYGNIDQALRAKQLNGRPLVQSDEVLAVNGPLNFVATVDLIVNVLNAGATVLLMDTAHVKNPAKMLEVFEQDGVTATGLTPSLYRTCKKMNRQMRWIALGGEPCVRIYNPDILLINGYSMSESGRNICLFPIDREYDLTPVGHNRCGEDILLLDEDGTPVAAGEIGEICFENTYVRGYINLPEKTAESWRNGIFHSGDLASRDGKGEFTLHGRKDDMVKIDGNRIEPAEIENAAKELLGLTWAAAKGFVTPDRSFVVLYYTENVPVDPNAARDTLSTRLPQYMLPSYFVHLDELPMLPNGKLDRKKLPMPDIHDYQKRYVPPSTLIQQKLCVLFEKILGVDRVGIDDDFYELGGDSVKSIRLLSEAEEPDLDVATIYEQRTVRRIAETLEHIERKEDDLLDDIARINDVGLSAFEVYLFDYQLYTPFSPFCNMPKLWKIKKENADVDRLLSALNTLIDNHPIFKSVIRFNDNMELVKHYDKSMEPQIRVENVTEKEVASFIQTPIRPFRLLNSPLYRINIFCTQENIYLFLDISHLFTDGTSMRIFRNNLSKAYYGESLTRDYHYLIAQRNYEREHGPEAKRAAQYNNERYGSKKWFTNVTPDHQSLDDHGAMILGPFGKSRSEVDCFLQQKDISLNVLCIAAGLLTIRRHERCQDVLVSWIFSGRESMLHENTIGALMKDLPVAVSFNEIHTADELLFSVKEQTVTGIQMSADPFVLRNIGISQSEAFTVRYQGDLRSTSCQTEDIEEIPLSKDYFASLFMNIQILEDNHGELSTMLVYNKHMIEPATGHTVSKLYSECVSDILAGNI